MIVLIQYQLYAYALNIHQIQSQLMHTLLSINNNFRNKDIDVLELSNNNRKKSQKYKNIGGNYYR